jgi:hypothetical protein
VIRKGWKKLSDEPLGAVVRRKHARRDRMGITSNRRQESELQREAKRRRYQSGNGPMEKW